MPVVQGTTLTLFAFAIAGFILTLFSPAHEHDRDRANTYAVAISSGSGLQLTIRPPADPATLHAQPSSTQGSGNASLKPAVQASSAGPRPGALRRLTCANVTSFIGIEVGTQCGQDTIEIAAQD